jgi:hypothetical protein
MQAGDRGGCSILYKLPLTDEDSADSRPGSRPGLVVGSLPVAGCASTIAFRASNGCMTGSIASVETAYLTSQW